MEPQQTQEQVPASLDEMQQWVRAEMELEAVAAEVSNLETVKAAEHRLDRRLEAMRRQLQQSISILRRLVVDQMAQRQLPGGTNVSGKEQLTAAKRQALVGILSDSELRAGLGLLVAPTVLPTQAQVARKVDCDARRDLCRAACCRLTFALAEKEITEGRVEWSLEQPFLRQSGPDGYCIHLNRSSWQCDLYDHRPAVCRQYSCQRDRRIWVSFEGKEVSQTVRQSSGPSGGAMNCSPTE